MTACGQQSHARIVVADLWRRTLCFVRHPRWAWSGVARQIDLLLLTPLHCPLWWLSVGVTPLDHGWPYKTCRDAQGPVAL